ncbi:uncharacterized protein DEA37_0014517 [Paragonimus westermani]|uniref:Uncharacterized protein n=1 Tax=Paragonimus westermani TaxID=34504 RepID=A0A5J4NEK3_9TREM|nr:uncharacterized protein DEA37_0014517 [Paragonimus westermani]
MNCSATSLSQIQKSATDWISQARAVMRELQTFERACQQYRIHQNKADEFCADIHKFSGSPQFDLKRIRNDIGSLDLIKKRHKNLKEKLSAINEHLKVLAARFLDCCLNAFLLPQDCEQDEEPIPSISELDVMRTEIARLRECKRHLEEQLANYCGLSSDAKTAQAQLDAALNNMVLVFSFVNIFYSHIHSVCWIANSRIISAWTAGVEPCFTADRSIF